MTDGELVAFISTMRQFVEAQAQYNDAALAQVKALQSRVQFLESDNARLSDHVHGLQAKRRVGRKSKGA